MPRKRASQGSVRCPRCDRALIWSRQADEVVAFTDEAWAHLTSKHRYQGTRILTDDPQSIYRRQQVGLVTLF